MDPSAMSRPPPPKMYSLFKRRPPPTAAPPVAAQGVEKAADPAQPQPQPQPPPVSIGTPVTPPLQPSHQTNVAQHLSMVKASKDPRDKLANKALNTERLKALTARGDEQDDDDDVVIVAVPGSGPASTSNASNTSKPAASRPIFDRAGRSNTTPLALSRTPSASASAVPVLVIPDSPPPKAKSTFQPLGEMYRAKRLQRKLNEPVEARWPNSEEQGHFFQLGSTRLSGQYLSRDPSWMARWSSSSSGKGKAIDRGSGSTYFDAFGASVFAERLSQGRPMNLPQRIQRPLAEVSSLVSKRHTHPLLVRIAAPFRAASPNKADFERPGEGSSTVDRKDNWAVKYAPQAANEVLGSTSGSSALKLKAWLQEVKVSAQSGNNKRGRQIQRGVRIKKKRRQGYGSATDLDDFVASDNEEVDYEGLDCDDDDGGVEELSPSSGWFPSLSNLILLAGSNGSGKTATVHAVANELGWEVFEVYPGIGKRTAKDIEKLVGDVGRNHTVRAGGVSSPRKPSAAATGGLFSMFAKQSAKSQPTASSSRIDSAKAKELAETAESNAHQSLILFEEVDVLYRDEKDFWSGLVHLATTSRRPIILTCTDMSCIPFSDIGLQTINTGRSDHTEAWLPFAPPEPELAAAFLNLVALAEGHIVTEYAAHRLYVDISPAPNLPDFVTNGFADPLPHPYPTDSRVETTAPIPDLRRSLMQLQFECQWGVGDPSGIGWMDFEPGREARTNWSFRTLNEERDRDWYGSDLNLGILRSVGDPLESYATAMEARSFVDAFVSRRPAVALEDYDAPPIQWASGEMLEGPSIPSVAPQLPHQLASSSNLEQAFSNTVECIIACLSNGVSYPSNEELRTSRLSAISEAASVLIPLAIVDAPAPILPSPRIFIDYLPYIRQITANEDLLEALQGQDHVALMGRRSTRSSRAAQRRPRRLGWSEENVETIRKGGFEGIEQDRWPEIQWEDEDDPIEDAAPSTAVDEEQEELAAHSSQISESQ
ncbi:BZ3500_MvSof-1268-A1-R1_Chr1-2g01389 [Microbotryum saponariae]|uniref:BZ3500_MvSof-1268-A1-R1_Chr1-2g01389 protein n=1 Tax=Microbotryum saponariae TaxID=289078 RepID=A0A2X0KIE0_9BASI|nr:BZ3500_MvSof-1268-A1-R1_Chr1-2g01389 [Microbotryum saponariae]SCZ97287.1 BZ3501_MvSof-1269-A2-R1_Chr1-2g00988 [Microbotryum saponariae]